MAFLPPFSLTLANASYMHNVNRASFVAPLRRIVVFDIFSRNGDGYTSASSLLT